MNPKTKADRVCLCLWAQWNQALQYISCWATHLGVSFVSKVQTVQFRNIQSLKLQTFSWEFRSWCFEVRMFQQYVPESPLKSFFSSRSWCVVPQERAKWPPVADHPSGPPTRCRSHDWAVGDTYSMAVQWYVFFYKKTALLFVHHLINGNYVNPCSRMITITISVPILYYITPLLAACQQRPRYLTAQTHDRPPA